jgi:hypothetical protein
MSRAWILSEVVHERREDRLQRLKTVLEACGFEPWVLDRKICDEHAVKRILVQHTIEPWRISYCDQVLPRLAQAKPGDVIIATEGWHQDVFRGLLGAAWDGPPVVEVWIDYTNSFAPWRAFSTEYCRTLTLGVNFEKRTWNERWIVAYPYFTQQPISSLEIFEDNSDGMDLAYMEYMIKGVPVLAPDWGAFTETIEHGKAGMRYKSAQAREYARKKIVEIPSAHVIQAVASRFTLEQAKVTLGAFLKRAIHEGTNKTAQYPEPRGSGCSVGSDS